MGVLFVWMADRDIGIDWTREVLIEIVRQVGRIFLSRILNVYESVRGIN